MSDEITYKQYAALSYLVTYGNLYHLLRLEYSHKREETTEWWRAQDPDGDYVEMIHDENVRWLIEMGYARTAEHDPMFTRAKIVPTQEGRVRLEHHGLTAESEGVGGHIGHCCKDHGCKYSDRFCPVESGMFEQDGSCESCYEHDRIFEDFHDDDLIGELERRGYTVTKDDDDAEG